jgi:hypothetical protein
VTVRVSSSAVQTEEYGSRLPDRVVVNVDDNEVSKVGIRVSSMKPAARVEAVGPAGIDELPDSGECL